MKFIAHALALVLLTAPVAALNLSKEAPSALMQDGTFPDVKLKNVSSVPLCMTKESMYEWVKKNKRVLYTLSPSGQTKLRTKVNMNKSRVGTLLLSDEAEFFFVPGIDPMNTAVAYFDQGCAIDEMTMPIDSSMLAVIFQQAGVLDSEIVKVEEA